MSHSEEEIRDAANAQQLLCTKLLEIMDLQGDIDTLMRGEQPTPFGSARWKEARPEVLQRLVAMTAVQFLLFEPGHWVEGNDKLKPVADDLLTKITEQLKWLDKKYPPRK